MNESQKLLLESARQAATKAYAPYSKFRVGAAVLTKGNTYIGANIENSSANLGICAERVALSNARVNGAVEIEGIAVFCLDAKKNTDGTPTIESTLPCGACRQWIAELAPKAWIVTNGTERPLMLNDLLPKPFKI